MLRQSSEKSQREATSNVELSSTEKPPTRENVDPPANWARFIQKTIILIVAGGIVMGVLLITHGTIRTLVAATAAIASVATTWCKL